MRESLLRRIVPHAVVAALLALPAASLAATHDNNVEWAGVSHVAWQDRYPLCPVDGQSFTVRFQTWQNDLTSAAVVWTVAGTPTTIPAYLAGTRGPYDVWQALLPGTATAGNYVFQLTDGTLTDYLSVGGMSHAAPTDGGFTIDNTTLTHAPIGATQVTNGVVFKVWSPTTTSARVRGAFDNWGAGIAMTRSGEYWIARVNGVADRGEYKYYFNNATWNTDPRARGLDASSGPYNAISENPYRYLWRTSNFATPPLEKMVIYQLHVGTFSGRNDPYGTASYPATYLDVAKRAGHLADLGVNAVMINPITEFPGDESAGYNPITQWSPEWKYGTPDQCKAMVDSLHARGIAVILDIVWNHFSPTDNFLWNYDGSQQWFETPAVDTPWGSQADFNKATVRDYFADAALHWLQEYEVDGFRMDATSYMRLGVQAGSGWALMQRLNDEINTRWADKITIAEQLPSDPAVTEPTSIGGAGFDAQYHMAFRDNIRGAILAAGGGDPSMSSVRDAIVGGAYLNGRYALNYFQLHDEAWPTSGGQRLVKTIDTTAPYDDIYAQGRMKLALGVTLLSPGVPAMLMGDEWLEDTDFNPNVANRIDWSKLTTYAPYYQCIQRMVKMRAGLDAFRADRPASVIHLDEAGNVIGWTRTDTYGHSYLVVANFSNLNYTGYRVGAPVAGPWGEMLNTQASAYGGSGLDNGPLATDPVAYDGQAQSVVVTLPAMGVLVFAPASALDVPAGAAAASGARIERLAPVPARDGAVVAFTLGAAGEASVDVLDLGGRVIARLGGGTFAAGSHTLRWAGRDAAGRAAPAGMYFVRLTTAQGTDVRRLPVVR